MMVCFTEQFPGKEKDGYTKARTLFRDLLEAKTLTTPIMLENPDDRMHIGFQKQRPP